MDDTFRYKDFDLSIFINGSYGNKVMNYLGMQLTHMNSAWENQLNSVTGRARLEPIDPDKVYPAGQYWYDDVTNVRVSNPEAVIPRASIQTRTTMTVLATVMWKMVLTSV